MEQNERFENTNDRTDPTPMPDRAPEAEAKATENAVAQLPATTDASSAPAGDEAKEPSKKGKDKKKKKEKEPRPRKKHRFLRFIGALLRFLLVLLLGMAIAYGSIVGALYYAVSGVTVRDLQSFGILNGVEKYLTDQGEVDLTTVTVLELISDLNSVSKHLSSYSLQTLITRYGLVLPEKVMDVLPTDLMGVPLSSLLSKDIGTVITKNLKMGYLLSFLPDGALSQKVVVRTHSFFKPTTLKSLLRKRLSERVLFERMLHQSWLSPKIWNE